MIILSIFKPRTHVIILYVGSSKHYISATQNVIPTHVAIIILQVGWTKKLISLVLKPLNY